MGPYIVDFLCERHHLVVELDGDTDAFQKAYDARRDTFIASLGYRVMRFGNRDILNELEGVLAMIGRACGKVE